jgi:two-component system C4-dicarboxylate transport response regulator DctD
VQQLLAYDWPGNVRELRNVAERTCWASRPARPLRPAGRHQRRTPRPAAGRAVEAFERALIADALRRHGGSLARTAEALAMPKTTLHDKIRKYGLDG